MKYVIVAILAALLGAGLEFERGSAEIRQAHELTRCYGQPPKGDVKCDPRPMLPTRCYDSKGQPIMMCPPDCDRLLK
jgi:hypothetical protein